METTTKSGYTVEQLEEIIVVLDELYFDNQDPINPYTGKIVSDPEYDKLRAELKELAPDSPVFEEITAAHTDIDPDAKKVKHNPPMTSINKAIGSLDDRNAELAKWLKECSQGLGYNLKLKDKLDAEGNPYFVQALKVDGLAVALYYEKGELKTAGLRPRKSLEGEDVTENVKYVEGIPQKLPLPLTCVIGGEIYCKKSVFKAKNAQYAEAGEKTFKNARNYASGSIRQFKDPKVTKERGLSFLAYRIDCLDHAQFKTVLERAKWCNTVLKIPHVQVRAFQYADLAKLEQQAPSIDYKIDGIVLYVNNIEDLEQLGRTGSSATSNPKGMIAWKFDDESATPQVTKMLWATGRTGAVTPVAVFAGVELEETTVTNCTCHNVGIVMNQKVGVGAIIEVIKSGKIIPKLKKVIKPAPNVEYPKECPSCGSKLVIESNKNASMLYCKNHDDCPAQNINNLVHYLGTFGVKGVGPSIVANLVSVGLVRSAADFYKLSPSAMVQQADMTERQAALAFARIHMVPSPEKIKDTAALLLKARRNNAKKTISLAQFFACLGIHGAGKTVGASLASEFQTIDAIRNATVDQLTAIEGIGPKTAAAIVDWMQRKSQQLDDLLKYVEPEKPKTGKLTGLTFVFTGQPPGGKEKWIKAVEELGARVTSSVSKKTNVVVIGNEAGQKADKAKELQKQGLKIRIIDVTADVEELENMLIDVADDGDF